jgi:hypothetical protein
MGKSKQRGGAKAHRKKVKARNDNFKNMWKRLQKNAWDKHEIWKQQKSGSTISDETITWNPDDFYPGDKTPTNERL